jgi:hypothetical protein
MQKQSVQRRAITVHHSSLEAVSKTEWEETADGQRDRESPPGGIDEEQCHGTQDGTGQVTCGLTRYAMIPVSSVAVSCRSRYSLSLLPLPTVQLLFNDLKNIIPIFINFFASNIVPRL